MPSAITGKVMQRIIKGDFKFPANVQVSPECIDLLRHIFTPDPDKRIKTESIKQHSWLSGTRPGAMACCCKHDDMFVSSMQPSTARSSQLSRLATCLPQSTAFDFQEQRHTLLSAVSMLLPILEPRAFDTLSRQRCASRMHKQAYLLH